MPTDLDLETSYSCEMMIGWTFYLYQGSTKGQQQPRGRATDVVIDVYRGGSRLHNLYLHVSTRSMPCLSIIFLRLSRVNPGSDDIFLVIWLIAFLEYNLLPILSSNPMGVAPEL
ncbi:hypothetical protein ACJX0J_007729 [Zea mays]